MKKAIRLRLHPASRQSRFHKMTAICGPQECGFGSLFCISEKCNSVSDEISLWNPVEQTRGQPLNLDCDSKNPSANPMASQEWYFMNSFG